MNTHNLNVPFNEFDYSHTFIKQTSIKIQKFIVTPKNYLVSVVG